MQKTELRKKIIRQRDFVMQPYHYEIVEGPSMTVPDEAMSIQEIMAKHVRGIDMTSVFRQPAYDSAASFDSEDIEKIQHEDLFDKENRIKELAFFQEKTQSSTSEVASDLTKSSKASKNKEEGNANAKGTDDAGRSDEGVAPPSSEE